MRWAGERAFLVECESLAEAMAFHARVVADPLGQVDQVAAARTVLLSFATAREARRAALRVADIDRTPLPAAERRIVEIDAVYDGEDLDLVAELTGLSREAVIDAHQSPWTAAFGGFAPGFSYLVGGDPRLRVPRRESPRTAVPAGSVALAGEFSAVYPRRSPGGWRLIGHTDARLWDLQREEPALIVPGDLVRFHAVRGSAVARSRPVAEDTPNGTGESESRESSRSSAPALTVVEPGVLTLIEDLGRPGYSDLGVTASGAADTAAALAASRLVGNARRAAVLETLGGLSLLADADAVVALTGADPRAQILRGASARPASGSAAADGGEPESDRGEMGQPIPAPYGAPFLLRAGDAVSLGYPEEGLRTYLAVRGGIAAPAVLGSRSRDVLGAVGPDPLRAGDALEIGGDVVGAVEPPGESAHGRPHVAATGTRPGHAAITLRIRFGPRDDMFGPAERAHLTGTAWIVGGTSDRVGARLTPADGSRPLRVPTGDLASEGVVTGALQVPPSGEPVLFGADHPVTGGYPVIAVVVDADLPRAAQLRPGSRVRFLEIDPESSSALTVA